MLHGDGRSLIVCEARLPDPHRGVAGFPRLLHSSSPLSSLGSEREPTSLGHLPFPSVCDKNCSLKV